MAKVYLNRKVSSLNVIWENFRKIMDWINNQSGNGPVLHDISDTTTIVGWTTYTTKKILYSLTGNVLTLFLHIEGESNLSQANFTLPDIVGYSGIPKQWEEIKVINVGSSAVGYATLDTSSNIVRLYRTFSEANWSSTGTKSCIGTVIFLVEPST